jgi:hypothetical protein
MPPVGIWWTDTNHHSHRRRQLEADDPKGTALPTCPTGPPISAAASRRELVEIKERTEVAARRHGQIATVYGPVGTSAIVLSDDVGRTE